ncbi:MAG: cupin domain-containing protein [Candidatus Eremiobacteraeota bacterium]|nr:cupin domain-containing protein [Candidatus Eremiobacteraeota bacterium]
MSVAREKHPLMNLSLGGLCPQEFLDQYWQKKPLLIRQAFADFVSPVGADELAGLACEAEVRSRMILERGGERPWELRHGPFDEDDFGELGDHYWTLLVQEVDRHVPAVADLADAFTFLPEWRKDDVMISFASNHGGVGPHTDSYDVFLLQGSGRRRWEIAPAGSASRWVEGLDIQVLADFEATESWELEPGDMLYLPPGVPHNGVALEPCLTYSFGFLAPTRGELQADLAAFLESRGRVTRYSDPELGVTEHPALLDAAALARLRGLVGQAELSEREFATWAGCFLTRPGRPALSEPDEFSGEDFEEMFSGPGLMRRGENVRWAYHPFEDRALLFVDGGCYEGPGESIRKLTGQRLFESADRQSLLPIKGLLAELYQREYLYFPEPM